MPDTNEPVKILHIESRPEPYVLVDLDTGTIISNPRQCLIVASDLLERAGDSDSAIKRIALMHGYQLSEVDWSDE